MEQEIGRLECKLCGKEIKEGIRFIRFSDGTVMIHKHCEEEMRKCIQSGHLHQ